LIIANDMGSPYWHFAEEVDLQSIQMESELSSVN
jgi:hypothetical protein